MDQDIRELNLTYLLKAREYAIAGDEQKARFIMGISGDALKTLKRMSIRQISQLADCDLMCFHLRYPTNALKAFERQGEENQMSDLSRYHLLSSLTSEQINADG
jgi:Flagellar transcriptional activator (FlhD)